MSAANLATFEQLKAGDRLKVTQRVKVGLKIWSTEFTGTVLSTERRRSGLHVKRNYDDKVFADIILMEKQTQGKPEQTTVVMDEFTHLEKL